MTTSGKKGNNRKAAVSPIEYCLGQCYKMNYCLVGSFCSFLQWTGARKQVAHLTGFGTSKWKCDISTELWFGKGIRIIVGPQP